MRQKQAKMLAKAIFGEQARETRRYGQSGRGCIVEVGPRGNYRHTKKAYAREHRLGHPVKIGKMVPGFHGLYQEAMAGLRKKEREKAHAKNG